VIIALNEADDPEFAICAIYPRRILEALRDRQRFRPIARGESCIEIQIDVPLHNQAPKPKASVIFCEGVVQYGRQIVGGLEKPAAWQLASHAADPGIQLVALVPAASEEDFCLLEEWLCCLPILEPRKPVAIRKQPLCVAKQRAELKRAVPPARRSLLGM
jgi:hypothetical protein